MAENNESGYQPYPEAATQPFIAGAPVPPAERSTDDQERAKAEVAQAKEAYRAARKKAGMPSLPKVAASIGIGAALLLGGGAAGWAIGSSTADHHGMGNPPMEQMAPGQQAGPDGSSLQMPQGQPPSDAEAPDASDQQGNQQGGQQGPQSQGSSADGTTETAVS